MPQPNPVPHGSFNVRTWEELRDRLVRYTDLLHATLHSLVLDDNFLGRFYNVTFPVAPNTDIAIPHGLGFIPAGYFVSRRNNAGVIYDGATAWTATNLYLRSTAASTVATVFVF